MKGHDFHEALELALRHQKASAGINWLLLLFCLAMVLLTARMGI